MALLKLKFTLFITKDTGKTIHYRPMYFSRFIQLIRHTSLKKAYVKVSYGKKICNYGCLCEFTNEGWTEDKQTLIKMLRSFLEK